MSASSTWLPPRAPRTRSVSSACVALRFGRKPYDEARKSASKMGSSTSVAAICATRSRTVGMPSGRCRPSAFGMYRRRTGCGRYVPARSAAPSSSSRRSTPYCSTTAERHRIDARRAAVPSSPAATPPGGRHASRSDPSGHGSGVPGIAWPRPRVGVAIGARCRWADAHRGSWDRTCRSCPCACLRRRRDHRRDPSLPSRCSSRGSTLLRSPRTPAAPRSISPSAYTSRAALTRAAQTGLSCSVRLRVTRAAPHTPPRPPARAPPD